MKTFRHTLRLIALSFAALAFTTCTGDDKNKYELSTDLEGDVTTFTKGETGSLSITISANIQWEIDYDSDWLRISPTVGKGNKTVVAYYTANDTYEVKSTVVTFKGTDGNEDITVTHTFVNPAKDEYPGELSTDITGDTLTFSVLQPGTRTFNIFSNLDWDIVYSTNAKSWLGFSSISGSGDEEITCSFYTPNYTTENKTAEVFIIGKHDGEEMERLEYTFILPPQGTIDTDLPAGGYAFSDIQPGEFTFNVFTELEWRIDTETNVHWLSFVPNSGYGGSEVTALFGENLGSEPLTTTITLLAFLDQQEAARVEYGFTLPPKDQFQATLSTDLEGETVTLSDIQPGELDIQVSSNVEWTIETDADWMTFTPSTSSGPGTVKCAFQDNNTGVNRTANVTFTGYYRDMEAVKLEYAFILPPKDKFNPALSTNLVGQTITLPDAQPGQITIQVVSNMEWEIEENVSWLAFAPDAGNGDASIICGYGTNTTKEELSTPVSFVGYQTITVDGVQTRRERARLDYTFILPAQDIFEPVLETDLEDDNGTVTLSDEQPAEFTILLTSNLNWTISNGAPQWLTFTPSSGTGDAVITCRVEENTLGVSQNTIVRFKGTHAELLQPVELEYTFVLPPKAPQLETDLVGTTITLSDTQPGSFTFNITSNINWEIDNGAPLWLGFTPSTGTGNAVITCNFEENTYSSDLSTTVKIIGRQSGTEVLRLEYTFILPATVVTPPGPSMPHSWLDLPEVVTDENTQFVAHFGNVNGTEYRNFSMLYDKKEHIAHWIAYPMHSFYLQKNTSRTDKWQYDPKVETQYQTNLSSSYGTMNGITYSRGHQVASSDRLVSKDMNHQTFYYTNMTPQNSDFNSASWNQLEQWIQGQVVSDTLYVVTGAVLKTVGGNETVQYIKNTAIPNYYYKVIMKSKGSGYTAIGFWYEHKKNSDKVSTKYAKTIREIEELTGFNFFANVPQDKQDAMEASYTAADWGL